MGLHQIDKPPTASGPSGLRLGIPHQPAAPSVQSAFIHPHSLPSSIPACTEKEQRDRLTVKHSWFWSGFGARPAFLLICRQPVPPLYSLVVELQTIAQRPNKCLPSSLPWYTALVGSMGSLLEDKINFWVMHVGRSNLNETRTLLDYKLTVTTEEKRYRHHPAQLSQTFSCSVTACIDSHTEIK